MAFPGNFWVAGQSNIACSCPCYYAAKLLTLAFIGKKVAVLIFTQ
jgi:hypothetical protein